MPPTLYLIAGLVLTNILSGGFAYIQYLRVQNAIQAKAVIESALRTEQQTREHLLTLTDKWADTARQYEKRNWQISEQTQAMAVELEKLRQTEENKALAAPFARGNVSDSRMSGILRRIEDRSTDSSSAAETSTPITSESSGDSGNPTEDSSTDS